MFIVMRTAPGHENWLKEEANLRAPELRPTVQGKGWVSFKFRGDAVLEREGLDALKTGWGLYTWWSVHEIAIFLAKDRESGKKKLSELGLEDLRERTWGDEPRSPPEPRPRLRPNDPGFWEWIQIPLKSEVWSALKYATHLDRLSGETELPSFAPSRAYLKLLELESQFDPPLFVPGQVAVECGASPGGMTAFLLSHGISVDAIDTGELDFEKLKVASQVGAGLVPRGSRLPEVFYVKRGVASMTAEKNEGKYDILVWDLNIPPPNTCREIERVIGILGPRLHTVIGTLKFNFEEDSQRVDRMRESLIKICEKHGFGTEPIFLGHVPSARREALFVLRRQRQRQR